MKLEEINKRTNEAISHLVAALEAGQSEVLTQYLNAIARFHSYSFGNIMLIARQKTQATHVAGVRTWNSLGRFVKKGEKGILILAPMIGRKKTDEVPESNADAKDATAQLYGFRAAYVFDVSQTEGKELPALTEVQGDVNGYRERLFEFVKSKDIELNYSEQIAPAKGLSHGGKITLLSGMQPAEEFSTLAHELAHLCCIVATVAHSRRSKSEKPKPKPLPSLSASPSDSRPGLLPLIMLSSYLCCVRSWKARACWVEVF